MPIPGSSSNANNGINEKVSVNDEDDGSCDIFISIHNNHNLNSYVKLAVWLWMDYNLMKCKKDYY